MRHEHYDERQTFVNYKLSHHALMILFVMLVANALVKSTFGLWAEPMAETIILILVPGIYYVTRSIFADAYMGRRDSVRKNVFWFLILAILFIVPSFTLYGDPIFDSGLTDTAAPLLTGIFFLFIAAAHIASLWKKDDA